MPMPMAMAMAMAVTFACVISTTPYLMYTPTGTFSTTCTESER